MLEIVAFELTSPVLVWTLIFASSMFRFSVELELCHINHVYHHSMSSISDAEAECNVRSNRKFRAATHPLQRTSSPFSAYTSNCRKSGVSPRFLAGYFTPHLACQILFLPRYQSCDKVVKNETGADRAINRRLSNPGMPR